MSDGMRFSSPKRVKVDELIDLYAGIVPSIDKILADQGISAEFPVPEIPDGIEDFVRYAENGDPLLPEDMTVIDDLGIGKLLTMFTNWTNYVQGRLTSEEIARDVFKEQLQTLESALQVLFQEEDPTLSDARAKKVLILDPRFAKAKWEYKVAWGVAKKLGSRYSSLKESRGCISRELTRRQHELEALSQDRGRPAFTSSGRGRFSGGGQ